MNHQESYQYLTLDTSVHQTDMEVLTKQLKNLNTSKSMGPDGCHPRLLRETADIVNIPLQKNFDKTFEEGCVPSL